MLWVLAGAVLVSPFPRLSQVVAGSRVVGAVDQVVPDAVAVQVEGWYAAVDGELFPRVFAGVEPVLPVAAPDPAVAQDPAVVAAGHGRGPGDGRGRGVRARAGGLGLRRARRAGCSPTPTWSRA